MRTYWVTKDKKKRKYFKKCAAVFKTLLSDDTNILAASDDDDNVIGFAAVDTTELVADIVFFYVFEDYRRNGCGRLMLMEIEAAVKAADIGMLRFVMPGNEGYRELFSGEGFDIFSDSREYVMNYRALSYSDIHRKYIAGKGHGKAKSVSELNALEKACLGRFVNRYRIPVEGGLDKDLSIVCIEKGKVLGGVLCEKAGDDVIVDLIYAKKGQARKGLYCIRLLDKMLERKSEDNPDFKISFATDHIKNEAIARVIAGDSEQLSELTREITAIKEL
ncbi:MAG: GNAT family N-acetyltransferase [Lachnospiraceae bacterium]|nr:GNAT family N-acetyltransferase [Lachnospiraceae bacterium]